MEKPDLRLQLNSTELALLSANAIAHITSHCSTLSKLCNVVIRFELPHTNDATKIGIKNEHFHRNFAIFDVYMQARAMRMRDFLISDVPNSDFYSVTVPYV